MSSYIDPSHRYTAVELKSDLYAIGEDDTGNAINACIVLAGMVRDLQARCAKLEQAQRTQESETDPAQAEYRHLKARGGAS